MTRTLAAIAASLALGGCMSVPALHFPGLPKAAPAASATPPVAVVTSGCPASITGDLKPLPLFPPGSRVPAAQTPEISAGFSIYLAGLKAIADWGKEGWGRLAQAQADCAKAGAK